MQIFLVRSSRNVPNYFQPTIPNSNSKEEEKNASSRHFAHDNLTGISMNIPAFIRYKNNVHSLLTYYFSNKWSMIMNNSDCQKHIEIDTLACEQKQTSISKIHFH